jgi:hypothetical protein
LFYLKCAGKFDDNGSEIDNAWAMQKKRSVAHTAFYLRVWIVRNNALVSDGNVAA